MNQDNILYKFSDSLNQLFGDLEAREALIMRTSELRAAFVASHICSRDDTGIPLFGRGAPLYTGDLVKQAAEELGYNEDRVFRAGLRIQENAHAADAPPSTPYSQEFLERVGGMPFLLIPGLDCASKAEGIPNYPIIENIETQLLAERMDVVTGEGNSGINRAALEEQLRAEEAKTLQFLVSAGALFGADHVLLNFMDRDALYNCVAGPNFSRSLTPAGPVAVTANGSGTRTAGIYFALRGRHKYLPDERRRNLFIGDIAEWFTSMQHAPADWAKIAMQHDALHGAQTCLNGYAGNKLGAFGVRSDWFEPEADLIALHNYMVEGGNIEVVHDFIAARILACATGVHPTSGNTGLTLISALHGQSPLSLAERDRALKDYQYHYYALNSLRTRSPDTDAEAVAKAAVTIAHALNQAKDYTPTLADTFGRLVVKSACRLLRDEMRAAAKAQNVQLDVNDIYFTPADAVAVSGPRRYLWQAAEGATDPAARKHNALRSIEAALG